MFALEIEYLMGRCYAGRHDNRQAPEWPPQPARLYSALVSAYYRAGLGDDARQALQWLEQQQPPAIAAGNCTPRTENGDARFGVWRVPTAFVPHNYPRNQSGRQVLPWFRLLEGKISRHFPSVSPARDRVHFIWRTTEAPEAVKHAFRNLVEFVGYLGTSASKVRMRICDSPPEPEFEPCPDDEPDGELVFCVPHRGRLTVLERAYEANRHTPPGRPVHYRRVVEREPGAIQSEFDDLFVLRIKGRCPLPARYTVMYTSALRDAMLAKADELGLDLSAIHGHGDTPHCAFLALPHTGHPHAEGMIKAFAIGFPQGVAGEYRALLRRAAQQIHALRFGSYGDCAVSAPGYEPVIRTADPATWSGPSRTWTSVTPVLYDRFPKPRPGHTAEDIISASCARIGLPKPVSIVSGKYSPVPGVPPVDEFRLQRKPEEQSRRADHMTLEFPEPVRGPVLIGAGRYFGLGLCRPLGRREEQP